MKELASVYGSGCFVDEGRLRLSYYNPFSTRFESQLNEHVEIFNDLIANEGSISSPYGVYPNESGLLPWGTGDLGHELYCLAKGSPNNWPIVVR
jgi:hypothetical protein